MNKKLWLAGLAFLPFCASAQVASFKETAQRALLANPEVQARFHGWNAAREERAAAAGGFLPQVDLTAGATRESRRDPILRRSYGQELATITLTQMLYDGFATRNEVSRLDHAALVRYFELRDISESIVFEVMRAYGDVKRYRELVALAEESYVRHRSLFDLIQNRTQAGVGRRVDLETASGRLALAEANLLTETSNLHDVTARFQRLTGMLPAKELGPIPSIAGGMPMDVTTALALAIQRSPALMAAVENIRSAESAARVRDASFRPRLDFQVRSALGQDVSGYSGSQSNHSAGLVMSWNLFSGGSDMARSRQLSQEINVAQDVFDRSCRDLRQTLAIAYNDTRKLAEQIEYLDQHQLATEKSRDAYRQQFDIGQRTLLDLLDTENELFQARRAYTNAIYDLSTAYGRAAATMGGLIATLDLAAQGADALPVLAEATDTEARTSRCIAEAPTSYVVDKAALDARASALAKESMSRSTPVESAPPATPNRGTGVRVQP
jgi:outer membrane protein, adhesin transport system